MRSVQPRHLFLPVVPPPPPRGDLLALVVAKERIGCQGGCPRGQGEGVR